MSEDRQLNDWLTGYMKYTSNSEPIERLRRWCGISTIASALQRKVWFNHGTEEWYMNFYIVLVSQPGEGRKNKAITQAAKFMRDPDCNITFAPKRVTLERLMEKLGKMNENITTNPRDVGEGLIHSSMTIIARELTVFMRFQNLDLMQVLTDWWDGEDPEWDNETKNKGEDKIQNIWINMLAATTPDQIRASIPREMISGGLSSRIIYVYAPHHITITNPDLSMEQELLQPKLLHDLRQIANMYGPFKRTRSWLDAWEPWYGAPEESRKTLDDPKFEWYFSRKQTMVAKLSCILCASRTNSMEVEAQDFARALDILEEAEQYMPYALGGVGKSDLADLIPPLMKDIALLKKFNIAAVYEKYRMEYRRKDIEEVVWHLEAIDYCSYHNTSGTIVYNQMWKPGSHIPKI